MDLRKHLSPYTNLLLLNKQSANNKYDNSDGCSLVISIAGVDVDHVYNQTTLKSPINQHTQSIKLNSKDERSDNKEHSSSAQYGGVSIPPKPRGLMMKLFDDDNNFMINKILVSW